MKSARRTGCLLCGEPLVLAERAEAMTCATCGASQPSRACCRAGHFVCDACHGAEGKEVIERVCSTSPLTDPVQLAMQLMRHEAIKLHGPEHHFLVPAVLLACWSNVRGEPQRKAERIKEARKRAEPIQGGFCGFQGACGAAVGVGIYASIATGATPLSKGEWRIANHMTAQALEAVARVGGPRCCKRDTLLAVLTAARLSKAQLGVALVGHGQACEWRDMNQECIGSACPFERRGAGAVR